MKITKKLLGQVINEELSRVLREAGQDYIEEPSAEAGLGEADLQSEVERGMAAGAANPMDIPEELLGDIGDIEAAKQKLLSLLSTNISEGNGPGEDEDYPLSKPPTGPPFPTSHGDFGRGFSTELHDLLMTPLSEFRNNPRSFMKSVGIALEGIGLTIAAGTFLTHGIAGIGLTVSNIFNIVVMGDTSLVPISGEIAVLGLKTGTLGFLIAWILSSAGAAISGDRAGSTEEEP